jgi:rubrerythrin
MLNATMTSIKASQAIRNAIESECASARFYDLLAERTPFPEARSFLRDMVAAELRHGAEIEGLGNLFEDERLPVYPDRDVSMVETAPGWGGAASLTFADAITIAVAAEQNAAIYYSALANQLPAPARDVFLRIARVEEQHAATLIAYRDGPLRERAAADR